MKALRLAATNTAPLSPTAILGAALVAWYKADAGTSSTTDGTALSAWNDQTANANNLAQATGAKQPVYKAAIQNGRPVVRFNGTSNFMAAAFTLAQPCEIIATFAFQAAYVAQVTALCGDGAASIGAIFRSSATALSIYAGTASFGLSAVTPQAWHMWEALFNGASSRFAMDNATSNAGSTGASSPSGLTVGATQGGASQWAQIDVGEIVVVNAALTTLQRSQLHGYLAQRWATP